MSTSQKTSSRAAGSACATSCGGKANGRPRLSVFRSSQHIYAQVIDDAAGRDAGRGLERSTRTLKGELKTGADIAAAKAVGKLIAERAQGGRRRARSCSTAAAICFMAGSRPWPTPPARAACRF